MPHIANLMPDSPVLRRQEALLAAISEKDANIALLELSSSKKKKTQEEVAALKREKDSLVHQLKQQVGSRCTRKHPHFWLSYIRKKSWDGLERNIEGVKKWQHRWGGNDKRSKENKRRGETESRCDRSPPTTEGKFRINPPLPRLPHTRTDKHTHRVQMFCKSPVTTLSYQFVFI